MPMIDDVLSFFGLLIAASARMDRSIRVGHSGQDNSNFGFLIVLVLIALLGIFLCVLISRVLCHLPDHSCNSSWPWSSSTRFLQDSEFFICCC